MTKRDGVDLALGALDEVPGMPLSTRAVGRSLRKPRCFEGCGGHATDRKFRLSSQAATRRSSFETDVSHRRTCHRSCARRGREGCSRDRHVIHGPTGSEAGSANGIADRHLIPRGKVPAVGRRRFSSPFASSVFQHHLLSICKVFSSVIPALID